MHIAEVVTIAKSLPLLRLNTYKSLILSYSADYRRIFLKKSGAAGTHVRTAPVIIMANDVSIIELNGSVNSGNLFLPDSQIDHCHLR